MSLQESRGTNTILPCLASNGSFPIAPQCACLRAAEHFHAPPLGSSDFGFRKTSTEKPRRMFPFDWVNLHPSAILSVADVPIGVRQGSRGPRVRMHVGQARVVEVTEFVEIHLLRLPCVLSRGLCRQVGPTGQLSIVLLTLWYSMEMVFQFSDKTCTVLSN